MTLPGRFVSRILPALLAALLLLGGGRLPPVSAQEPLSIREQAEALAEEARQHWDLGAHSQAIAKYRESIALRPSGKTYRELGDLFAERDRHQEAIGAYLAAITSDPSLEPELRQSLGVQYLWSDRAKEAVPLLESVVANRPHDVETKRLLALAYRWDDRLAEAERLYRKILDGNPGDPEARKGLAESLLWQGRFRAAVPEYGRILSEHPDDPEALTGVSRAWLFLDLPEQAAVYSGRAVTEAPHDGEARAQVARVRERLAGRVELEASSSRDSDDLSIFGLALSTHARPARGLDLEASARQLFYRQGSPGKGDNLGNEDSIDGTGGSVSIAYRGNPAVEWRAGAGITRYDAAGFHPWSGHFGTTLTPVDTVRFDLDWERSHWNSILSLQNRVTTDTVTLAASKQFLWKTEVGASAALLYHHNENDTGQDRENRGGQFSATISRRLYLTGDVARVTGTLRLRWLGFSRDLDVGVFDPERYTTEEAGVDWEWRFLPLWEFRGTVMGGAQQEKGAKGGPTYSAEAGLDRRVGTGLVSVEGFAFDSNAKGQGEGFRRYGGLLRLRIPF